MALQTQNQYTHRQFERLDASEEKDGYTNNSNHESDESNGSNIDTYWYHARCQYISSGARLETLRQERRQALMNKLEKEFEQNPQKLQGVNVNLLTARAHMLINALVCLKSTYLSFGLTDEESLYGRVHLAAGKGTMHIELLLGEEDADEPDSFATFYSAEKQQWSLAGDFRQVIIDLKARLGITSI